jgi:hypothetical protein
MALALTLGGTVLLAAPVWADAGSPDANAAGCAPAVVVTPITGVSHGGTIVVSLENGCASSTFTIVVKNKPVGTIQTDEFGNGSAPIVLPCRVGPGTHDVLATDTSTGDTGSASVTVTSGGCASAPGHMKSDGSVDTSTAPADLSADASIAPADVVIDAAAVPAADQVPSPPDVASAG